MTYKEESFVLDSLIEVTEFIRSKEFKQLVLETHENNLMLRQIVKVINTYIANHLKENSNDFTMNVLANLISNGMDISKVFRKK